LVRGLIDCAPPSRELPDTSPIEEHRGLELLEEQLQLFIVEVELTDSRKPLFALRGSMERGIEARAVARENRIRPCSVSEMEPDWVSSAEQLTSPIAELQDERRTVVDRISA